MADSSAGERTEKPSGKRIKDAREKGQVARSRDADDLWEQPRRRHARVHAELTFRDGQWRLVSRGRNGVLVGSQTITEIPVLGDVTFRLGTAGPLLKFNTLAASTEGTSATLSYTADTNPLLHLDETKLQNEVDQIASDEYFVRLQQKVKELRRSRDTQVPH